MLVICDMVIERYILNLTTIWQIDVVTYAIVGATFIGSAYVLMTRGHVNVEILPLHAGPRARYWLALFTDGAGPRLLHRALGRHHDVLVRGLQRRLEIQHRVAGAPRIPYLSMPVGLGLLVLEYIAKG